MTLRFVPCDKKERSNFIMTSYALHHLTCNSLVKKGLKMRSNEVKTTMFDIIFDLNNCY